jgi:hypothetical protein
MQYSVAPVVEKVVAAPEAASVALLTHIVSGVWVKLSMVFLPSNQN